MGPGPLDKTALERSFSAPHFWGSPEFMPTQFNTERPNWGGAFLDQPRAICTNASRGLSATADFLVKIGKHNKLPLAL